MLQLYHAPHGSTVIDTKLAVLFPVTETCCSRSFRLSILVTVRLLGERCPPMKLERFELP